MHVLEPHWVTDAVYRIINSKKLAENHGELHENDLNSILKKRKTEDYSYTGKYGYIIELMKKFELCFAFPDGDGHYLIPELLDKQQPPEADNFKAGESLNFSYCYPILPEGLLPRFIVRTHILSRNTPRWRTGVILKLEDNKALVVADVKAKRVFVRVKGPVPGRQRLLAVIRSDFEHIHSSFTFQPEELVAVPQFPNVEVKYKDLLVRERRSVKQFSQVIADEDVMLDVQELLNGVDMEGTRKSDKETERKPVELFYSYSHKDEELRNELETHLKILERTGVIHGWHDRKITAGEEWKGKIDENLEKADIILLLVSADFIASDYCYDIEMKRAMERYKAKEARVIPVIIRDVNWTKAPFAKLQALPKEAKAVIKWRNRDTAWLDVSKGIETVAGEILRQKGLVK
jgi:internalin A